MSGIKPTSFFVSAAGGVLDYVDGDGQLLFQVAVPPGRVSAREFVQMCPAGAFINGGERIVVLEPRRLSGRSAPSDRFETGANPDYRPTSATPLEMEMRQAIARMNDASARVERRAKALAAVETIPQAPAPVLIEEAATEEQPASEL